MSNKYLDEKVMLINIKGNDCFHALDILGKKLYKEGYVKESYMEAIKKREEKFATGLPSEGVGVAIPHADIEHVNKPIIGVGILENPVKFRMMGNHHETISVEIMFMLALNEHHTQIEMLQNLMGLIQDKDLLVQIKECKTIKELMNLLEDRI
ncbi:MAG: PTS sugar transporter subunit IIA [Anaeromicrobium sp.]|jgi:PTS system galactitol-specific IIA component|uniref:PTS sugar transporter subunit IIA n=1 Tax=Anaeromicrobium sp. TaxID=1929132 RepID=UPI0025F1FBFB|nr:PTS sugar transporter subunit IIA [Anaeromicrobium sp.]MCT4593913.1 PTS sugar transporter subunit IIA [Anaeromicrobium sp.]